MRPRSKTCLVYLVFFFVFFLFSVTFCVGPKIDVPDTEGNKNVEHSEGVPEHHDKMKDWALEEEIKYYAQIERIPLCQKLPCNYCWETWDSMIDTKLASNSTIF